jgi:hypothetical protein
LQDIVYSGLVKALGISNVIEYPWNIRYHINFRPYPKNIGLVKGGLMRSLISRMSMKQFDMVIVASCHPDAIKSYLEIIDTIPSSVPTAFIDGGDWPNVAGDLSRVGGMELYEKITGKRPFDFIFKREYLLDSEYEKNVYSLPFACNMELVPRLNKKYKYDVSFWAVESHQIRTDALNLLQGKFDCELNQTVPNQTFKSYSRKGASYLRELARCKIVLNFRGGGWDTLRYWEVPAVSSLMISQMPRIRIANNFEHGSEVIYCSDDLHDLIELCDYYLKHEDKRKKIAERSRLKLLSYHTDVHRAREVLSTITQF